MSFVPEKLIFWHVKDCHEHLKDRLSISWDEYFAKLENSWYSFCAIAADHTIINTCTLVINSSSVNHHYKNYVGDFYVRLV